VTRSAVLLLAIVFAACGTDEPDLQGTYQVQVTGTVTGDFPSLHWPATMTVVLALDDMGNANVTLDGASPRLVELTPSTGEVNLRTLGSFPLSLVDPHACHFPLFWTGAESAIMTYHFHDGVVEAHTSGGADCDIPGADPDLYIAHLDFDLVGPRTARIEPKH
jgi:hypothetical protein